MSMRFAALAIMMASLAACESAPSKSAWLMQGDVPWVGTDGRCMQLRPLAADEKKGFCYDVMTDAYQRKHHYEALDMTEFGFLYPQVQPTAETAYNLLPPPSDVELLAGVNKDLAPLPYIQQIYTVLPFTFGKAHLSSRNRQALDEAFQNWRVQGIKVVSVAVTGHTDNIGPKDYNFLLSKWRAQSVSYYLTHIGVSKRDITLGGVGMLLPHPEARNPADNRYVDLRVWLAPPDPSEKLAMR